MDSIVALPSNIVEWLSDREQLENIDFFTEFPPINKAVPLKKAIVAVGIKDMKIIDKFVENDDGVLERQEYCRTADINARLSICVPYSYGGTACHEIFTKIIDELTFNTDLNITESQCEEIQSDRNTSALVLTATFRISADFCPAEVTDENFFSFLEKDFLCGSHINDTDIHVTPEEKESWGSPIVSGYYFGNGSAIHNISLGFKPRFVLIFGNDKAPLETNNSDSIVRPQFAFGSGDYCTQGLNITSTGFTPRNSTYGNSVVNLNVAGNVYCYIAMK